MKFWWMCRSRWTGASLRAPYQAASVATFTPARYVAAKVACNFYHVIVLVQFFEQLLLTQVPIMQDNKVCRSISHNIPPCKITASNYIVQHRIMDLRAGDYRTGLEHGAAVFDEQACAASPSLLRLKVASAVAAEARMALKVIYCWPSNILLAIFICRYKYSLKHNPTVQAELGFRASAGIAENRLLAKLASGLHKPDDQTVLPASEAEAFVAPLPLRAISGIGLKMASELQAMGLERVADLRERVSEATLKRKFGDRVGAFLYLAARGQVTIMI